MPHPNGPIPAANALLALLAVLDGSVCNFLLTGEGGAKRKTPVSDYLHGLLAPALVEVIPEGEFDRVFDEVEFLFGVVCESVKGWGPIGRWTWRQRSADGYEPGAVVVRHQEELLAAGLFEGSEEKLLEDTEEFRKWIRSVTFGF